MEDRDKLIDELSTALWVRFALFGMPLLRWTGHRTPEARQLMDMVLRDIQGEVAAYVHGYDVRAPGRERCHVDA